MLGVFGSDPDERRHSPPCWTRHVFVVADPAVVTTTPQTSRRTSRRSVPWPPPGSLGEPGPPLISFVGTVTLSEPSSKPALWRWPSTAEKTVEDLAVTFWTETSLHDDVSLVRLLWTNSWLMLLLLHSVLMFVVWMLVLVVSLVHSPSSFGHHPGSTVVVPLVGLSVLHHTPPVFFPRPCRPRPAQK